MQVNIEFRRCFNQRSKGRELMIDFPAFNTDDFDGFSLLGLMRGHVDRLERRFILSLSAFEDALALIDLQEGMKYHLYRGAGYELLYDLRHDPEERYNLADERPQRTADYRRALAPILWRRRATLGNPYHYRAE